MGNKYSSVVRTYTARNLIWNTASAQPVPFVMNAPAGFFVAPGCLFNNFYRANWPRKTASNSVDAPFWSPESTFSIKRVGIFSNFADGLVQYQNTKRMTLKITAAVYTRTINESLTPTFVEGSNKVTGMGLYSGVNVGNIILDDEYDQATASSKFYPYFVVGKTDNSPSNDDVYISDYSARSITSPSLVLLTPKVVNSIPQSKSFTISNIPTLNSMYESEIFFPFTANLTTNEEYLLISCKLGVDTESVDLQFMNDSVNIAFNGDPISFDSIVEIEATDYDTLDVDR